MATDVYLYAGEASPNDIRLRDPTTLDQGEEKTATTNYFFEHYMWAYRRGRRTKSKSKK